jgi:hypothetical protein
VKIAFKKIIKAIRDGESADPEATLATVDELMRVVRMVLESSEGKKKKAKRGKKRKAVSPGSVDGETPAAKK